MNLFFLTGYADSLLREAMNERPLLARFSQIPHEQKIAAFAACDRDAISENCKRIIKILDDKIPELYTGASRDSEMGVLTGEFNSPVSSTESAVTCRFVCS